MEVKGRNLAEGIPRSFTISSNEILEALTDPLNSIVSAVKSALEQTPPELGADIAEKGMVLTGGGALLRELDRLLMEETGLPVIVADDPLTCVVRGSRTRARGDGQARDGLHERLSRVRQPPMIREPPPVLPPRAAPARAAHVLRARRDRPHDRRPPLPRARDRAPVALGARPSRAAAGGAARPRRSGASADYFASQDRLLRENQELKVKVLEQSAAAPAVEAAARPSRSTCSPWRRARAATPTGGMIAEVLYNGAQSRSRARSSIDKGLTQGDRSPACR